MSIIAPKSFKHMCRNFGQDVLYEPNRKSMNFENLAERAFWDFEPNHASEINSFIEALLAAHLPGQELVDFWWSMPSDMVFYDGLAVTRLLTAIRAKLKRDYLDSASPLA